MNQHQVDIDNVRENAQRVMHDYAVVDLVYVEMTGIYSKIYYKKQWPNRITEVCTNGTVRVQQGELKVQINIRWLRPHFDE